MEDEIINKVAQSGIVNFDLEEYYTIGERQTIDIKDQLFQGLILKEKDFREFIKSHDWKQYQDKLVSIICSADAIIPSWAYMLIGAAIEPYAKRFIFGTTATLEDILYVERLAKLNLEEYNGKRVVIKGCGKLPVPNSAYVEITRLLRPSALSIMYGEACSTVPIYKQKKAV